MEWHSPDGKYHNQIDYNLVKKRFRSGVNIHRTRSFPGADIGSDHDLVMMTEQIFNLRIMCKKYLQHQQNLYHVFIDLKNVFDRVWHAALWATMRKYNISANLVRTIELHYDKATSAVQMNGSIGEWFRTTVGVRQRCLLSPTLFNVFLERIMSDALEEHDGKVSIGGRNITNLRFADDIDALAEEEQELEALVEPA